MNFRVVLALTIAISASASVARASSTLTSVGDGVAIALPVVSGAISLSKDDTTGIAEMSLDTLLTVGTAYGLSRVVREERPNHSDDHSFPSKTSALAFAPAAFLWDRYGWTYGLPAYAAATFVGYTRVNAREHHWWDVAASAGIGWTYSEIFTTRFRNNDRLAAAAYPMGDGVMLTMCYQW